MTVPLAKEKISADREVDFLYGRLRGRYGESNPQANGYRSQGYFLQEQRILFSLLDAGAQVVVDVGCGSGLMIGPLARERDCVCGIDFNADACRAAKNNGLAVIRGDAFSLPLNSRTVDELVTCQFFNQQKPADVAAFIAEAARVLKPGGRVIMVWRNADAWVHRLALWALTLWDSIRGRTLFPHEHHTFADIRRYALDVGLQVEHQEVTFPPFGWRISNTHGMRARLIGASCVCILRKLDHG
jgi:SAM-dependent methyltransferase